MEVLSNMYPLGESAVKNLVSYTKSFGPDRVRAVTILSINFLTSSLALNRSKSESELKRVAILTAVLSVNAFAVKILIPTLALHALARLVAFSFVLKISSDLLAQVFHQYRNPSLPPPPPSADGSSSEDLTNYLEEEFAGLDPSLFDDEVQTNYVGVPNQIPSIPDTASTPVSFQPASPRSLRDSISTEVIPSASQSSAQVQEDLSGASLAHVETVSPSTPSTSIAIPTPVSSQPASPRSPRDLAESRTEMIVTPSTSQSTNQIKQKEKATSFSNFLNFTTQILDDAKKDSAMLVDNFLSHLSTYVTEHDHSTKQEKYKYALSAYKTLLSEKRSNIKSDLIRLRLSLNEGNNLNKLLYFALEILYQDPYPDARKSRVAFIQAFRALLLSPEYNEAKKSNKNLFVLDFVDDIAEAIFEPKMLPYLKKIVNLYVYSDEEKDLEVTFDHGQYSQQIEKLTKQIDEAPIEFKKSKIASFKQKGSAAFGYEDIIGKSNVPYIRNQMLFSDGKNTRTIDYCRHGCPTVGANLIQPIIALFKRGFGIEDAATGEWIAPEFAAMVKAMERNGEGYLYSNHQRRFFDARLEVERDRVQALEKFEEENPNFYLISQSVESTFYKKCGPVFEKAKSFKDLRDFLFASFFYDDNKEQELNAANRLPYVIRKNQVLKEAYKKEFNQLFAEIHSIFFNNVDEVKDAREWSLFIDIFYAKQRFDLAFWLPAVLWEANVSDQPYEITRMVSICKDDLDRGGNQKQISDILLYYRLSDNPDKKLFRETAYNLLGAPILVKKQSVLEHRITTGLAFADLCHNLPKQKKAELRRVMFNGWKPEAIGADLTSKDKGKQVVTRS